MVASEAGAAGGVPPEVTAGFPETLAEISGTCRVLSRAERESRRVLGEQAADAGLGLPATVLNAADPMVLPVLPRDRAAMADLVRTVPGPLEQARSGAVPLVETITDYTAAGYVNAGAARRLDLRVRALSYRLAHISALTGLDPDDALQRHTPEAAALGVRLPGGRPGSAL